MIYVLNENTQSSYPYVYAPKGRDTILYKHDLYRPETKQN